MAIQLKRAYDPSEPEDGYRVLVDRLWPRGISKEDAAIDHWLKEIAPSDDLRKWFGHDQEKWGAFRARYRGELEGKDEAIAFLREKAGEGTLTLIYAAKDTEHNNAVVLKEYLQDQGKNH